MPDDTASHRTVPDPTSPPRRPGSRRARRRAIAGTVALGLVSLGVSLPAHAATVTLPDMTINVPTSLISIGIDPATQHRMLRYTHITEDSGTGPFELDPSYDATTGIASWVQRIYNSPSPGTWTTDHTVPLAVNGVRVAPDDFRFPLTSFTLNHVLANGTIGAVAATSPKTDYCMTGDTRVGDVPNTPAVSSPSTSNCGDPTLPLGWSVGWGDQYDQTDSGQPIDLTGVPDGSYALVATVDPQHVLTESNATNNVTVTKLTIAGASVTVGAQTRPATAPPSVRVTSPAAGSSVSGTVPLTVTATANAPASVASVQYLLDGSPLGPALTAAPFGFSWTVGSTPPGPHRLSARVTDTTGLMDTAPVDAITVAPPPLPSGLAVDQTVTAQGHGSVTAAGISPRAAGEVFVALVGSDGPPTAGAQTSTVSGGGLTWRRLTRADTQFGDSEIWTATASGTPAAVSVTAVPGVTGYDQQLTVLTFAGAAGAGAAASASAGSGAPSVPLVTTAAGSLAVGVGNDWDAATARTPVAGQLVTSQWLDAGTGDTFWTQGTTAAGGAAGSHITIADTAPTADRWNLAAAEVVAGAPAPPDTVPPTVAILNPAPGQTVSGTVPVAASASDNVAVASVQFLLDGAPLGAPVTASPYSVQWDTTTAAAGGHTLGAVATDTSGNHGTAAPIPVTVQNPAPPMTCFVLQAQKTVHGTGTVSAPSLTTALPGEFLVAFVASDGPASAGSQQVTVAGGGLTWTLAARSNGQAGDAEIWTAPAAALLSGATITSTPLAPGYDQSLTVIATEGVAGAGATATASAVTGAPSVKVTTAAATSLVFAVGADWDNAIARTLPTGLVPLDQWVDTGSGDTMWSEYTNQATGAAGSVVTIGATAPTTDRWDVAAVELRNSGG
ncbi:Ig-like domain-containing protein [Leifsonia shinshuensis]